MRHTVRRSLLERIKVNANFRYSADDFGVLLVGNNAQIVEEDNADFSLGTGMSYRASTSLTLGMSYSYRLDRQWSLNYTATGVERELERRNPHRNMSTSVDYRPTGSTNVSARASRSRQRRPAPPCTCTRQTARSSTSRSSTMRTTPSSRALTARKLSHYCRCSAAAVASP